MGAYGQTKLSPLSPPVCLALILIVFYGVVCVESTCNVELLKEMAEVASLSGASARWVNAGVAFLLGPVLFH